MGFLSSRVINFKLLSKSIHESQSEEVKPYSLICCTSNAQDTGNKQFLENIIFSTGMYQTN